MKCEICLLLFSAKQFSILRKVFFKLLFPFHLLKLRQISQFCAPHGKNNAPKWEKKTFFFHFFRWIIIYFRPKDESNDGRSLFSSISMRCARAKYQSKLKTSKSFICWPPVSEPFKHREFNRCQQQQQQQQHEKKVRISGQIGRFGSANNGIAAVAAALLCAPLQMAIIDYNL